MHGPFRKHIARVNNSLLHTVRGRLIIGLAPGLITLLILLGIGLLVTDILVSANKRSAEAGWELAITRSLQLNLQQILIPFEYESLTQPTPTNYERFLTQADDFEALFSQAQAQYGEEREKATVHQALLSWKTTRQLADRLLNPAASPLTSQQHAAIQAGLMRASTSTHDYLEELNDIVLTEMQKTVAAGQQAHDRATVLLIGSTLIAFLAGASFLVLFANYITHPLDLLTTGARRIGGGDLNVRLDIVRHDEFGILAREFNLMVLRLQERTTELETVSTERAAYAHELQQVLKRDIQIQEAERKRISHDIHDGVSQWLMGALFQLQAARVRLSEDEKAYTHLKEAQRVLKEAKEELRRVIYDLHPPLLESRGLAAAIRGHVQEQQRHSKLITHLEVSGEPIRLAPQQELAIFRIVQEALANVQKHAHVHEAWVQLEFSPDKVCLAVIDHGQGFRQDDKLHSKHLGLFSMRERAVAVGAEIMIHSKLDEGTTVHLVVPAISPSIMSANMVNDRIPTA